MDCYTSKSTFLGKRWNPRLLAALLVKCRMVNSSLFEIPLAQAAALRERFLPDEPGPLVALHVLQTKNGRFHVNQWPYPTVILAETAGNYALCGTASDIVPADLYGCVRGFVAAERPFVPLLHAAFPELQVWQRVILTLEHAPTAIVPSGYTVRQLTTADLPQLQQLSDETSWVAKTWGGLAGLAASGVGWGAFGENGRLLSLANTFFLGHRYEDVGIATEPEARGLGLGSACAAAVCHAIQQRGRTPSWTTSPDNEASLRVAHKLGFRLHHTDQLYVINIPIPAAAQKIKEGTD